MRLHHEHASRLVRLEHGELVGYPPAEDQDCTIWFDAALQRELQYETGLLSGRS